MTESTGWKQILVQSGVKQKRDKSGEFIVLNKPALRPLLFLLVQPKLCIQNNELITLSQ